MSEQKNIIDYFFETFETKIEGLDYLNRILRRNYKHNTISEWQNPSSYRMPTAKVYETMVLRVISTYPADNIAHRLRLPYKNTDIK